MTARAQELRRQALAVHSEARADVAADLLVRRRALFQGAQPRSPSAGRPRHDHGDAPLVVSAAGAEPKLTRCFPTRVTAIACSADASTWSAPTR
jgi:hypothetical protein